MVNGVALVRFGRVMPVMGDLGREDYRLRAGQDEEHRCLAPKNRETPLLDKSESRD